jgi:hypothetical protein
MENDEVFLEDVGYFGEHLNTWYPVEVPTDKLNYCKFDYKTIAVRGEKTVVILHSSFLVKLFWSILIKSCP